MTGSVKRTWQSSNYRRVPVFHAALATDNCDYGRIGMKYVAIRGSRRLWLSWRRSDSRALLVELRRSNLEDGGCELRSWLFVIGYSEFPWRLDFGAFPHAWWPLPHWGSCPPLYI